jgi:hypothetical protein
MVYASDSFDLFSLGSLYASNAQYNMLAGNNTVMIPLNKSSLNMAGLAGNDMGAVMVSYFDATAQDWFTASYVDMGTPEDSFWDGDFATTIGMPLMVYVNADTTWPLSRGAVTTTHRSSASNNISIKHK